MALTMRGNLRPICWSRGFRLPAPAHMTCGARLPGINVTAARAFTRPWAELMALPSQRLLGPYPARIPLGVKRRRSIQCLKGAKRPIPESVPHFRKTVNPWGQSIFVLPDLVTRPAYCAARLPEHGWPSGAFPSAVSGAAADVSRFRFSFHPIE